MIRFLLEKEFKQIFRSAFFRGLIFIFPIAMLLVMPWAANQEIKEMKLSIIDNDLSTSSGRLIEKIISSGHFKAADISFSNRKSLESIEAGEADAIIEIRPDFERDFVRTGAVNVMVSVNSVNSMKGSIGSSRLISIINQWVAGNMPHMVGVDGRSLHYRYLFNPSLDFKTYIVPALTVMLMTMLCGFLPALNMAGEKESGTIEQLNAT
ncbi:MAG: ABC transporter permease, partial [Dysgonamonadaceae bacterium]|nr:ABC transporter permease [Dysgonamonadaceae bacterium]